MMQAAVTTIMVVIAACYALWRLLPDARQQRVLQRTLQLTRDRDGLRWLAQRLDRALAARLQRGTGCDSCAARPHQRP